MKQSQTLQLKLTQHLTLTPQLQQSIRLLQLSTIELNAEVERLLQENPLLEKAEVDDEGPVPLVPLGGVTPAAAPDAPAQSGERGEDEAREPRDNVERSDFEDYSSGEGDWGGSSTPDDDDDGFYPQQVATSTLRDHLLSQLAVLNLEYRDRQIVGALIDALDEDGYLHASLEEIAELFPDELEIDPDELSIALRYVQSFERAGVGARDAAECLALQLKALPEATPFRAEALALVVEHLPLLAARDFTKLKRFVVNALDFRHKRASHAMVPRPEVVALALDNPVSDNIELMRRNKFSRYPVFRDTIDNIVGIVHTKDIIKTEIHHQPEFRLEKVLRDAVFLPETVPLQGVLEMIL